jgi:hypothetical protein
VFVNLSGCSSHGERQAVIAAALTVIAVLLMVQSAPVAGAVIVATFVIHLAGLSVFGVLVARYF